MKYSNFLKNTSNKSIILIVEVEFRNLITRIFYTKTKVKEFPNYRSNRLVYPLATSITIENWNTKERQEWAIECVSVAMERNRRLLLLVTLVVILSSSSSSAAVEIESKGLGQWHILTKQNFSSQIRLHPHILLFVSVPCNLPPHSHDFFFFNISIFTQFIPSSS